MTKYEGQREDGAVELLRGETPGLIFTEADRRRAFLAIQGAQDGGQFDFATLTRLFQLSELGHSHQAKFLFGKLTEASPESILGDDAFVHYTNAEAPRDSSGLVVGYDDIDGAVRQAQARLTKD